jgi:hypothetical protein
MNTFSIKAKHFLAGESTLDYGDDRGFSFDSDALNLQLHRGWVYAAPGQSQLGSSVIVGNPLLTCLDPAYLGNDNYIGDDGGNFYTLNGTTVLKLQTVTADTFTLGTSDMIPFKGNIYATSASRIIQLTNNLAAVDSSWWTGLDSTSRHPLERVEDKMYIGNLNVIEVFDGTNTSGTGATAITLPTNVNITSLRRHPDGKNLIAFCGQTVDFSHTRPNGGMIYIVDTNLKQWTREIQVESQVEGSRLVGGVVYVTYGQNVGYFTGSGIKFLKRLTTATTTYNQGLGNMEDILLVADGLKVKAFGDLGHGRVWWPIGNQFANSNNIKIVAGQSNTKFLIGFASNHLDQFDVTSGGTGGTMWSNRFEFGREVMIKRIVMYHNQTNGAGLNAWTVYSRDTENTPSIIKSVSYSSQTVVRTVIESEVRADFFQIGVAWGNGAMGFKLIRIYYEPIE